MPGIQGPFTPTKFCGATVRSIQSTAGWQEQVSELRLDLVETDGDLFVPPEPGTPMSFTFEGFRFDGIVQRWGRTKNTSGNPVYTVSLYSPVEILEMAQVILDGFHGVNMIVPNLLNVYGYLEGIDPFGGYGFGGAGKNEAGIRWFRIRNALENIQTGQTDFGPAIQFKGHTYIVDFSSIPDSIPDFYRVGGFTISLGQLLRTVFEDSGYDFLVELRIGTGTGPHTIGFKTRSRLIQQPLGQIATYTEGKENIASVEDGAELRNDITCGVILGGQIESSQPMIDTGDGNTIWPFWGFQPSNFLVPFGLEGNQPFVPSGGFGNDHTALLDSTSIVDVIGSLTYACSVFEMRLALASPDAWSVFIARKRPEVAEAFGLEIWPCVWRMDEIFTELPESFYSNSTSAVALLSSGYVEGLALARIQKLYEFVRSQAETYMGKQFVVRMPFFIKYYFEEDTNRIMYDMEPSGDGYWADYIGGPSGPLGLDYQNFNRFMNEGKFIPYVRYSGANLQFANLGGYDPEDLIIQNNGVFVKANLDPRVLFGPAPCVLVVLNTPIWSVPVDPLGGIADIAWLCDMDVDTLVRVLETWQGEFPIGIHPWPLVPDGANICFRNNSSTYGPWAKVGVPGKVRIVQEPSLVPWQYGGFETMNRAAQDQLADIGNVVNQVEETGSYTEAGAPTISLGDQLNGVGPVITSIDVSVSEQGVTTSYRMRSQTAISGTFSKQNAERLRRLGTAAQEMRRTLRGLFDRIRANNTLVATANTVAFQDVSRAISRKNASAVLQAYASVDQGTGDVMNHVATQSFEGAMGASHAHEDAKYQNTASMGMEGLLRPFTTNKTPGETNKLPHMQAPVANTVKVTSDDLNPFTAGSDIHWAAHSNSFQGYFTQDENVDWNNMRPLSLRGPMWITGWGYDVSGKPVPNSNEDPQTKNLTNNFITDYKKKSNLWKSGPADWRWNRWAGKWVSGGGMLFGTYQGNNVVKLDDVDDEITVSAYFNTSGIANGTKVGIAFDMIKNVWKITTADC